jgi:hypothetical protein
VTIQLRKVMPWFPVSDTILTVSALAPPKRYTGLLDR